MKYIKYIGKNFKIYINKCKVCDYCVDHCDWGCPKENIENEVVIMTLEEIIFTKSQIIYKFKKDDKIFNIEEKQIIEKI